MLETCWVVPEKSAAVKAALARKLRKKGYTQRQIAEALEITQPSVSAYLKKRIRLIKRMKNSCLTCDPYCGKRRF